MRWPQWYLTRADVLGILFALIVICISAFPLMWFPPFIRQQVSARIGIAGVSLMVNRFA
jgi:hypothetical protein